MKFLKLRLFLIACIIGASFLHERINISGMRRPDFSSEAEIPRVPRNLRFLPPSEVHDNKPHAKNAVTIGTAFATENSGRWFTAYHVAENCSNIALRVKADPFLSSYVTYGRSDHGSLIDATLYLQANNADLAMLSTRYKPSHYILPQLVTKWPQQNEKGFAIGFPGGNPGQVATHFIGATMGTMHRDQGRFKQPLFAWAIDKKDPDDLILGGISGGPLLNKEGRVIGVNTAGNDRRGRLMTSMTYAIHMMLEVNPAKSYSDTTAFKVETPINDDTLAAYASQLRANYTIAQVICFKSP